MVTLEEGDKVLKVFWSRPIMATVRPDRLLKISQKTNVKSLSQKFIIKLSPPSIIVSGY